MSNLSQHHKFVAALKSSPKGQLKYCKIIDATTPERLAKEIQENSLADKLVCPIILPSYDAQNEEVTEEENLPSFTVSEFDEDECDLLVDSAFWDAFYGRILLQKYEHESQLEILAKIQKKIKEHEKKQEILLQSQLEELSLKVLQGKEKQEAFNQAWQAESLKALRAHKEREEKYQREFDAVVGSIQKQRLEQEAKRVEEEKAKKKLEEEERQKNQEYAKIVNKVLEEQKRFTTVYKEISDVMKSCPDKKQLVPIATPLLTKLTQSQKAMVQCVSDVKAYQTAKAAASDATRAVAEAEEVLAGMKKAVDHLTSEARKNAEKQAVQQQQAAQLKAAQAAERLAAPSQAAGTPARQDQSGNKHSQLSSQARLALPDDLSRYTELQEFLQRYLEAVKPVASDPANVDLRRKCKMFITTIVNSVNGENPDLLRDKYEQLHRLLTGKVVMHMDKSINAGKHPVGIQYCKSILAHKIVEQGEKQVASNPDSAYGYTSLSLALMSEFEDLRNLVFAYFYKHCPYLVPYCPVQQEGQSDEDYYRSLGYVYKEGKVEDQNLFVRRITGIARLYFAMSVSHLPREVRSRNPQAQHSMPLHVVFKWMTSVIQLNPVLDVTAALLVTAIEVCGSRLMKEHPNEMRQIISYLSQKYLPKIVEVGYGAPVSRLEVMLERVMSTGFIPAPKIIVSMNAW